MREKENLIDRTIGSKRLFFILITIVALFNDVPLINDNFGHIVKGFLLWSVALIGIRLWEGRIRLGAFFRLPGILLILFFVCNLISILTNRQYPLGRNLSTILYMIPYFAVLYGFGEQDDLREKSKTLKWCAQITIGITTVYALIGLGMFVWSYQYAFQRAKAILWMGMKDNRLWGLYNANVGGIFAVIAIALSMLLLYHERRRLFRVGYIFSIIVHVVTLILTQSRGAVVSLLIFLFIYLFARSYNHFAQRGMSRWAMTLRAGLIALAASAVFFFSMPIVLNGLSYVPWIVSKERAIHLKDREIELLKKLAEINKDKLSDEIDGPSLERIESLTGSEVTSGRIMIWKAGIQEWKRAPLFGISSLGINNDVSKLVTGKYAHNVRVGGLHNTYVTILVASGLCGALCFVGFMVAQNLKVLGYMRRRLLKSGRFDMIYIGLFGLVAGIFVAELIEARTVYGFNAVGVLSWIIIGHLDSVAGNWQDGEFELYGKR